MSRDVTHFVAANVAVFDPWKQIFIAPGGATHAVEKIGSADLLDHLASLA